MGCRLYTRKALLGLMLLGLLLPSLTRAGDGCVEWAARLVSLQGQVEQRVSGESGWTRSKPDARLCPGDTLRIGANSRAAILLRNETLVRLDQLTTVTFPESKSHEQEQSLLLEILRGVGYFFSRTPKKIEIRAPFVNAAIEGTEFLVAADPAQSRVLVLDGVVRASNARGELRLTSGEGAVAGYGEAPRHILVVHPQDAVKWALYYPPVIGFGIGESDIPTGARDALSAFDRGDVSGALSALDQTLKEARTADYYVLKASILLYVGRVEKAETAIARALELDPGDGGVFALKSIVSLVLHDAEAAMRFAQEGAQAQGSQGAASQIALSYVYQSRFDLNQALVHAHAATELAPDNALGWARLAELDLALGRLGDARQAAAKATSLNPRISRVQTTLGFAQLLRFENDAAAGSFKRAIALDQADPLPRLGLGLSKIHRGQLEDGRAEIEIAATIDSTTSIFRSYLGKAYYEEKRDALAGTEYRIAKELDAKDPTPWFYDAIRKQTMNRPVDALEDMQHSIALNDNRAVYRSSLELDSDLAARSASQARIYTDLGFEDLALVEGWSSVNDQPQSFSAHRFLADAYLGKPQYEVARVSELLQSQLWQPLNLNPIQPQLAQSNLGIVQSAGPTLAGLNEYNPLFLKDGIQVQTNLVAGSDETFADDLALSVVEGIFSLGVGQFHYETEGFRPNADQNQDLYNLFFQASPSPDASVQVEYRHYEAELGDTVLRFDPDNYSTALRYERTSDTLRIGGRYEFSPSSKMIASVIGEELDLSKRDSDQQSLVPFDFEADTEGRSISAEVQHAYEAGKFNLISGLGYLRTKRKVTGEYTSSFGPFTFVTPIDNEAITENYKAYLYSNYAISKDLTLHTGLSYNDCTNPIWDRSGLDPKLGLSWKVTPDTEVRAAAFQTVRCAGEDPGEPALALSQAESQTIEPTQIAGFNQLFDDSAASTSDTFGVALDHKFTPRIFAGVSAMRRDIKAPFLFSSGSLETAASEEAKWREDYTQAYLNLALDDNWTLALAYQYEMQDYTEKTAVNDVSRLKTERVPLSLRYFSENGFSAGIMVSYVDQEIQQFDTISQIGENDQEQFWIVDASLVYRLPKRYGFVSLEVKNLFNEEFRFQEPDPDIATVYPDRIFLVKLSLNFN